MSSSIKSAQNEAANFQRYFLVDYENVNRDGLNGVTKLNEEDCVRIYYSDAAATLTFGLHRRINSSKAHFEYIKVQIPIKNAVDCQILFDVRDLSKENRNAEYFIVSKDTDFNRAVEEFKFKKIRIKKVEEICKSSTEEKETIHSKPQNNVFAKENPTKNNKREAQVRSFFGRYFKDKQYVVQKENIIELLIKAESRQEINNGLQKYFVNGTVSSMLKILEPLIKDLPGK